MKCWIVLPVFGLILSLSAIADAADPLPLNLALGKPATASSTQDGNGPQQAVDGDNGTRWCAADESPAQWWQIDLQQPEALSSCRIDWEFDGVRYQYKIEGSADAKTWSMLVDQTHDDASTRREQEFKLDAKGIRFVRLTTTKLQAGRWASFHEFELYGGGKTADPATLLRQKNAKLLNEIKLPQGLSATMFAAPPDVAYPVCLAAAPNGDVFVGVDANGSLDQKPGRGRILRCRDTNNDGIADEFKTFAEVDSPRGMVWDGVNNVMYVQHPPFVRAYHDDDADGVSDRTEPLVEGIGYTLDFRGADHTTNGMQIGIDGWLYIAVGDYGFVKATGRDGKSLQLCGGGVVRVRTDGTQLEIVSRGQRNIYDVAISPMMDLFTRDNTNDGDGWDEHLSHVVSLANFGYPSLFKNFPEDSLKALADYGGGSPTGSIFLDEPGLRGLFTCDWGTNRIDHHPLQAFGATFKAEQQRLIEMPRPIDIDVDAASRLYIASWRGGGFAYSGPDVGYVVRITGSIPQTTAPAGLIHTDNDALLTELASDSHVRRLNAQREILKRADALAFAQKLEDLALSSNSPAARVAATFTLAQLAPSTAQPRLMRIAHDDVMREFALRALADARDAEHLDARPFIEALKDPNARVRLAAIAALARLHKADCSNSIIPLVADIDPVVAHVAVNALRNLGASQTCLAALDAGSSPSVVTGAARVLGSLHQPEVVDGLIRRLGEARESTRRHAIFTALCRLYYREADWTGGWWGTRPDTSGPYFKPVTWEQSETIIAALKRSLASADAQSLHFMLVELQRHKIDLPEASAKFLRLARTDASLRDMAVDLYASRPSPPPDAADLFAQAVRSDGAVDRRARALSALCRTGNPVAIDVLAEISENSPADLFRMRGEFVHDPGRFYQVNQLAKFATGPSAATRELAYSVLLHVAQNKQAPKEASAAAAETIEHAWAAPASTATVLRAIGKEQMNSYSEEVRKRLTDADLDVRSAAQFAAARLSRDDIGTARIGQLPFDQILSKVLKSKGDAKQGAELFVKQTCALCHTVSKNEPPKGPFLGGIAKRYSRTELVESIVKPNAKIAQGFGSHYFVTKKRQRIDGFVVREAGDEVEVRTVQGLSVTLKNADIARKGTMATSIMPEQLVDNLSPDELTSLIAYLESLKAD